MVQERILGEWMKVRGIRRVPEKDMRNMVAWMIPSLCPELDCSGGQYKCRVYEDRPAVCRFYDGLQHPEVDCKWQEEV